MDKIVFGRSDGMYEYVAHTFLKDNSDFIGEEHIPTDAWMVYSFEKNSILYFKDENLPKARCFPLFQPRTFGFYDNDEFTRKAIRVHCLTVVKTLKKEMRRFARGPRKITTNDVANLINNIPKSERTQMVCLSADGELYHGTLNTITGRDGDERYSPITRAIVGYREMPKVKELDKLFILGTNITLKIPEMNKWIARKFNRTFWKKPKGDSDFQEF